MSNVTITLTPSQHSELKSILLHYSTRADKWAISSDLRLAVAEADKQPTVEVGGQTMTQAQHVAALYPHLTHDPGPVTEQTTYGTPDRDNARGIIS